MQIFVKTLAGTTVALDVNPSESILGVKTLLAAKAGVAISEQRLLYGGIALEDEHSLEAYAIQKEYTLDLAARLCGGAKKRKKKNYTTPKKNKHKKKKVKLPVLKFYKVDESGKITRLRRECENAECGAGVFMANHFDRHYCGRCGVTLVYNKPEDK